MLSALAPRGGQVADRADDPAARPVCHHVFGIWLMILGGISLIGGWIHSSQDQKAVITTLDRRPNG